MKEINNEKIFDLLAIKSYEELNDLEREMVAKELSKQEYNDFRDVVEGFKEKDDEIELITSKNTFKEKTLGKRKWWNYKIPTYQVAAVLVIAILSTFMLTKKSIQSPSYAVETNGKTLDTLMILKKSITIDKEEYPSAFVIHW
ncbi:hypothetical protein [Wenyingzhuangia sp. 2_MG-2023]|uniref:hypothetical protein n=1 Tax=Wenyingzhuangia sp. 2_MG-2023 TaxID=3062639 RepID=UPI0026E1635F|nr:hypothetical protein [Wenyingzhuangia sp. 2_MG-2023]MDO6736605.1 hypothetical protein [Wenyingzhuangia sp. 2_MG-2023]